MKRRLTLSIAFALSVVLVSLTSSDRAAQAQQGLIKIGSGTLTLGPNQKLRLTVAPGDVNGDGDIRVRFRQTGYRETDFLLRVVAESTTNPIRLMPNQAASFDINRDQFDAVSGIVLVNRNGTGAARTRVTVHIIDTTTGEVNSVY